MTRFFTPLNWTLGVLFFAVAVFFPVLDEQFLTGSKRLLAEQVVDRIARQQERHYQLKETYVFFPEGAMPPAFRSELGLDGSREGDFSYAVFPDAEGRRLIIQARVTESRIRRGSLPPLTYTYSRELGTGTIKKSWSKLSGKKPGLF